jgi:signal transduction histidine kinase/FixJ family two-component response regulator
LSCGRPIQAGVDQGTRSSHWATAKTPITDCLACHDGVEENRTCDKADVGNWFARYGGRRRDGQILMLPDTLMATSTSALRPARSGSLWSSRNWKARWNASDLQRGQSSANGTAMVDTSRDAEILQMEAALALAERRLKRSESAREQAEMLLEVRGHALAKANSDLRLREAELLKRLEKDSLNLLFAQEVANIATFHVTDNLSLVASRNFSDIIGHETAITHMDQVLLHLHPDEDYSSTSFLMGVSADENGESRDLRFLDSSDNLRWIRWHIKSSPEGFHGALHDITHETELSISLREQGQLLTDRVKELENLGQALEEARREAVNANQAKSRFLAMMSHDIRTPMNAILAMLELLAVADLTPEQAKMVRLALASGNQMLILLADIIEIGRADGWTFELSQEQINLPEFLESVSDSWRELARRKALAIELFMDRALPEHIETDRIRLRQVLDNLISNAVKYTQCGSVKIDCALSELDGKKMLRVAVIDTGAGIAKEEQQKLFNDLQRVTGALHHDVEGTGLGLSICARIVAAMQGKIGLESYVGHGSTFWFMVPLVECDAPDLLGLNPSPVDALGLLKIHGAVPHLLVAEDIETNQIVMRSVLDKLGCTCTIAKDGIEALEAFGNGQFDAILMDVSMPRMDGVETTRRIRAMTNGQEHVPIIGVTAFAGQEEQISLLAAGMNRIVVKPIKPGQLRETLAALFEEPVVERRRSRPDQVPIPILKESQLVDLDLLNAQLESVPGDIRHALADTVARDLSKWHASFVDACNAHDSEGAARAHHALKGVCEGFGVIRYSGHLELARNALLEGKRVETELLDEVLSATLAELKRHANRSDA